MSLPVHTVRRATINDLATLRAIWSEERFAVGELERRFTEFQIVESSDGKIIGALALQIQGNQGHIHSEAIAMPEHTEAVRAVLWDRLKKVATNHGLVRLWTPAVHTHWTKADFRAPTEAEQGKRASQFGQSLEGWLVLQLKEEVEHAISLEHELAIFREAQKAESAAFNEQAKKVKVLTLVVALLFAGVVTVGIFYWLKYLKNPDAYRMPPQGEAGNNQPTPIPTGTNVVVPSNAPVLIPAPLPAPQTNQSVPEGKTAN
ncbi:MAG TPA: hypothetical protein VGH19_03960 [Verrucomicrobiae bacterium]